VNDIFSQFRAAADDLQAQRDALWKQYEKEIET